jgi:hypothetical protein
MIQRKKKRDSAEFAEKSCTLDNLDDRAEVGVLHPSSPDALRMTS